MTRLSVVLPVYNEAPHLPATIEALLEAVERSRFEADLIVVDDGSTDGSAEAARASVAERLPLTVLTQSNEGRFSARRAGLEAATADWVLLLDGRVRIDADALAFVHDRLADTRVWNGHVHVDADGNPYGAFWKLVAELAWPDYFEAPTETSFGSEDFDRYPKGTTFFLAPTALLLAAVRAFRSRYADLRSANDDTPVIRFIAERERIHLSPRFACEYSPRTSLRAFLRHAFHRGTVFLDGHARRGSRFLPLTIAFFPVSAAFALAALRRPLLVPVSSTAAAAVAGGVVLRRGGSRAEATSFAALAPVYLVAHGAGMWRGLLLLARGHGRGRGS
jgi:glycosyltransferase involved in cell wall biosynthesis